MNSHLQLALELLDRSNATYVVTHSCLKEPIFSEDRAKKPTKLVVPRPVKRSKKPAQHASKWRALLSDIPRGGSKILATPAGLSVDSWQARVAGACSMVFGSGNSSTARAADGSHVAVTRK